jgi:phosphotransferase system, enzyme I, PtsP
MTTVPTDTQSIAHTIHTRGAERLDAVVDLVVEIVRARPLAALLDSLPRQVAAVFKSEVCSVYLREGDGLVMRGNVGFTSTALGEVRLGIGEGIVGMAVEVVRPVSADLAQGHARYRGFSMLQEERFPAFLAVPVPGSNGPAGALVVQRSGAPYTAQDIELLMALAGAVAPLVDRARIVKSSDAPRPSTSGTRRVTLPGRTVVSGRGLGMLTAIRRPEAQNKGREATPNANALSRTLERAIQECDNALDLHKRAAVQRGADVSSLQQTRMILEDGRLRERTLELASGRGLDFALAQVAREATKAARLTDVPLVTERAMEMSELCDALRVLIIPEATSGIPRGAVWVAETMTVYELVLAARARPAALVLTSTVASPRCRSLMEMLAIPSVSEVSGIFSWASDGDVALVDGDHGLVRVNPTRRERDEARVERSE